MKRTLGVYLCGFVFLAICCITPTVSFAQDKAITIKITNWFPVGSKWDKILQEWGQDLEQQAGGKVKINYYGGGTLAPSGQTYDAILKGIADVGQHSLGYTMGRFPFSQGLDMPLGWPEGSAPTLIANEFYRKFKPKEFDNVKVLLFHACTPIYLATKTKPVRKLEDVKGLKIRSTGSNAKFVGLLGAAPVAMPMPEVYDALSRGVADGLMTDYAGTYVYKTGEHLKYATENASTAYTAVFVVAMNKKKFESLPPDVQKIVERLSESYIDKWGKIWTDDTAMGKEWLQKRGVEFIRLSKEENDRWFEQGAKPLLEGYIKDMKTQGMPGKEAVDFLLDSIKKYKK